MTQFGSMASAPSNVIQQTVDLTQMPGGFPLQAGDTLLFQFFYRDVEGGGAGFNLTDGHSITFTPLR